MPDYWTCRTSARPDYRDCTVHEESNVCVSYRHSNILSLFIGNISWKRRADTVNFKEEIHQYMQYMIAQVDSLQKSHPPGDQPAAVSFLKVQATAPSDFNKAEFQSRTHLTAPKLTPDMCLPSQEQPLSPSQVVPLVVNCDSSTSGGSLHFANLPNPVHKMFESLHVTDRLIVSELIEFLRALVRLQLMAPAFRISTAQICKFYMDLLRVHWHPRSWPLYILVIRLMIFTNVY